MFKRSLIILCQLDYPFTFVWKTPLNLSPIVIAALTILMKHLDKYLIIWTYRRIQNLVVKVSTQIIDVFTHAYTWSSVHGLVDIVLSRIVGLWSLMTLTVIVILLGFLYK